MIEAMVRFNKSRKRRYGSFIGSRVVVEGDFRHTAAISMYHRRLVNNLISLVPGEKTRVKDVEITATPVIHTDKSAIGFILKRKNWTLGITGDTEYFDELPSHFEKLDCLIVNCLRPGASERIRGHMTSLDVIELVNNLKFKPSLVILTHLGMRMIQISSNEAGYIEGATDVKTIAARDFLSVSKLQNRKNEYVFNRLKPVKPVL